MLQRARIACLSLLMVAPFCGCQLASEPLTHFTMKPGGPPPQSEPPIVIDDRATYSDPFAETDETVETDEQ